MAARASDLWRLPCPTDHWPLMWGSPWWPGGDSHHGSFRPGSVEDTQERQNGSYISYIGLFSVIKKMIATHQKHQDVSSALAQRCNKVFYKMIIRKNKYWQNNWRNNTIVYAKFETLWISFTEWFFNFGFLQTHKNPVTALKVIPEWNYSAKSLITVQST